MHTVLFVGNYLENTIGSRSASEDLLLQLRTRGWSVLSTSRKRARLLRLADMLQAVWNRRSEYQLAHVDVYSGPAFFWAEAVCALLRRISKPYALTLHGGNLPSFARTSGGRVRRLLESAALVVTPSRYLQEQMRPYREELLVLPNPIEITKYRYRPRDRAQPRLVWLRAFHSIYNPQLALHAVQLLRKEFPDIRLTMTGPDKGDGTLAKVRAQIDHLGLTQHVLLRGAVPKADVPHILNEGDIFLNTTDVDNTPVSVLEAMACGLCVVSTNVGGIPYLLQDREDALLVNAGNPDAIARAVRKLVGDPSLAKQLSSNARRHVEHFDWSAILPRWEAALSELAKEHRGFSSRRCAC